ncbi:MAG: carboxymuconolactone decarboxylase family protein [Planctomycetota bacterium]|jgi:AhpD family alkylhydroperoxidase
MAGEAKEFFEKLKKDFAKMQQHAPDAVSGFSGLFGKVMKDGALSVREKELIALGIAVSQRCEPCIRAHVRKSLDAGARTEQIVEAACVAVVMQGGPAYMHLPIVIDTLEALQA